MTLRGRAEELVDRYNRYGGPDDVGMMVAFYEEALERAAELVERWWYQQSEAQIKLAAEIRTLKEM